MKSKYLFSGVGDNHAEFVECPSGKNHIYGPQVDRSKMTTTEWLRYLAAMRSHHKRFIEKTTQQESKVQLVLRIAHTFLSLHISH